MNKTNIENTLYFLLDKIEDCYKKECKIVVDNLLIEICKEVH